jgi:hypothetical protein
MPARDLLFNHPKRRHPERGRREQIAVRVEGPAVHLSQTLRKKGPRFLCAIKSQTSNGFPQMIADRLSYLSFLFN